MIEIIKKSLLAGIGAAAVTKDKIEEALEEFVREGKVTAADARRMAEKLAAQGRHEFHTACADLSARLHAAARETAPPKPRRTKARRPAAKRQA